MRRRLHHKALKGVLAHGHLELDLIWSVKRSRRRDEHRESSRGRLHLLRAAAPKGDADVALRDVCLQSNSRVLLN